MVRLFSKRIAIVCIGFLTAIYGSALVKTIQFNRMPDSYTDVFGNGSCFGPVFIEGKVLVDCGANVSYRKDSKDLHFGPFGHCTIYIRHLPFISYYDITYSYASATHLTKQMLDSFVLFLDNTNRRGEYFGTSVKQITLTYGVNFVWENFRYSLLTDETAQVERCVNSTEIVVPSILEFAQHGFYDVTVTTVDAKAFANLSKLTKVTLPSTIESIGRGAFVGSPNLNTVVVQSATPPTLSEDAFDAKAAQNIAVYVPAESYSAYKAAPVWKDLNLVPSGNSTAVDGVDYTLTSDGKAIVTAFENDIETVAIPSSVSIDGKDYKVAIGLLPTGASPNLKSIYIGEDVGIQSLPGKVVPNLKKLFYLGTSAPYVNPNALAYNAGNDMQVYGVSDEAIAPIVEQTGGAARVYPMIKNRFTTDGLVYIPTSTAGRTCDLVDYDYAEPNPVVGDKATYRNVAFAVKKINPYLFHQAKAIQSITVTNELPLPANFAKGTAVATIDLNCGDIPAETFINSANLSKLTVNTKGNIGENAFANCGTNLSEQGAELELNNVGVIESNAFQAFGPIDLLHIGKNVTEIKPSAFVNAFAGDAEGVADIECNGAIGAKAFYNTHNIKSLAVAECVTGIEQEAFRYAMTAGEASATLDNSGAISENSFCDNAALTNVTIGDGCTSIASTAFADNESLKAVTIGDGCETIADQVFMDDAALETVVFGDAVKSIGNEIFKGNAALKDVTFGSALETLGNYAFDNCEAMERITVKAVVPPVCGTYDFRHVDTWSCELLVPRASLDAYIAASQWNEFMNLAAIVDPKEVTDIVIDSDSGLNDIFAEGLAIFVNDRKDIPVKVMPETADAELSWSSSDEGVATAADGTVTGVAAGEAAITISAGDYTKTFGVTVSKREQTIEWNQEFGGIEEGATIELTATASSFLSVEYTVVAGKASVDNATLSVNGAGIITVEASQPGNDEYMAALPVRKTFNAVSGVEIVANEDSAFKIEGSELVIMSGNYCLYNMQGVMLEIGSQPARIALLPKTAYILKINGKAVKLMAD